MGNCQNHGKEIQEKRQKAFSEWVKEHVKNALKQENAEDYRYVFRWEFIDEESEQNVLFYIFYGWLKYWAVVKRRWKLYIKKVIDT